MTLTLKIGTHTFRTTLQVTMIHQHTKLSFIGGKKGQVLHCEKGQQLQKILSKQIFLEDLNSHCDHDLEDSNHNIVTQHSGSWWCTTMPNLVAKRSNIQGVWKKQLFFGKFEPALWPWRGVYEPKLFAWHSGSWWSMHHHTKLSCIQLTVDATRSHVIG